MTQASRPVLTLLPRGITAAEVTAAIRQMIQRTAEGQARAVGELDEPAEPDHVVQPGVTDTR